MDTDITTGWGKFADECNKDRGYAHSYQGGLVHSKLVEDWRRECPGLETPQVLLSNDTGRYEVTGLGVPKQRK